MSTYSGSDWGGDWWKPENRPMIELAESWCASIRACTDALTELRLALSDFEFDAIRLYITAGCPFGTDDAGFRVWYEYLQWTTNN